MEAIYPFDPSHSDPAGAGVPGMVEDLIAAPDGTLLVAWERPADPGRATLLYLPGNAGNLWKQTGRIAGVSKSEWLRGL